MVTNAPVFFVPFANAGEDEKAFVELAAWGGGFKVPPLGERIYSIEFLHNGVVWTATVGQPLEGIEQKTVTRHGKKVTRELHRSDTAVVMAIYPDPQCWHVVTNRAPHSTWESPFMAGIPRSWSPFGTPAAEKPAPGP